MSQNPKITTEHLLTLIGRQVLYHQQQCEIIELLDSSEFVLQVIDNNDTNIQATQYGEGHRTVPITHVLPIFDGEGNLHSELLAAGLDRLISQ